jgi:cytochrome b561
MIHWRNTKESWGRLSRGLHWLMAPLVLGMLGIGIYMTSLPPSDQKWMFYGWHKSFGIVVLALVVIRLSWRLTQTTPSLAQLDHWQVQLAKINHYLLYLLMFIMPLSGAVMSQAGGHPVKFFEYWTLPTLITQNPLVALMARQIHGWAGYLFLALIAIHVGAALYHHFILKDKILKRMVHGI